MRVLTAVVKCVLFIPVSERGSIIAHPLGYPVTPALLRDTIKDILYYAL
jgi:hypothetical protein